MSNYLAIATVTAVLRDFLQGEVVRVIPGADVTTRRPEAAHDGGQHKAAVNIFLYMVTPNPAWRNTDIEYRYPASPKLDTERIKRRPQVPLNLSYLLSFYGNEVELEPQRLLGRVVSALHAYSRLSPEAIRSTVGRTSYLRNSDLAFQADQVENITLTPIGLNLEELSKLWSVFFQVPYALSVAYQACSVLIEPVTQKKPDDLTETPIEKEVLVVKEIRYLEPPSQETGTSKGQDSSQNPPPREMPAPPREVDP